MKTKFKTWFQLSGGTVKLRHIDLETDGMKSHVNGFVNFGRWPEQEYRIHVRGRLPDDEADLL
jgi:hypothetical protein